MGLEKYCVIKELGSGGFGSVWQAANKHTGEIVAIKVLNERLESWEICMSLPEIKAVIKVMDHANIVKLKEVIWHDKVLYLVFEYMEGNNLYSLMVKRTKPFSEAEVKNWCFQVFQGLAYIHGCGFIHRDIKPDNLLLSEDNNVKIADFGLALDINSQVRVAYIGTRYYRAPEILLQSRNYGYAVDIWAMGATMAELLGFYPLFPGSDEADQLCKICGVIGSPKKGEWDEGLELARILNYKFPQTAGVDLSTKIPSASEDAIHLIKLLCSWDPSKRPTAGEVLRHRFFLGAISVPPCLRPEATASITDCGPTTRFGYGDSRSDQQIYSQNEQKNLLPRAPLMQQGRDLLLAGQ